MSVGTGVNAEIILLDWSSEKKKKDNVCEIMYWKMGVSTEPGFLILGKDNTDHNPETIDGIVVKHCPEQCGSFEENQRAIGKICSA